MNVSRKIIVGFFMIILSMIVLSGGSCTPTPPPNNLEKVYKVTGTWTPPSEGSPVKKYVLFLELIGGDIYTLMEVKNIRDTFYTVSVLSYVDSLRGKVAGIDEFDRVGEYTEWDQGWLKIIK